MLILLETMAEERRTATAPELLEPLMAGWRGGSGGAGRAVPPHADIGVRPGPILPEKPA